MRLDGDSNFTAFFNEIKFVLCLYYTTQAVLSFLTFCLVYYKRKNNLSACGKRMNITNEL